MFKDIYMEGIKKLESMDYKEKNTQTIFRGPLRWNIGHRTCSLMVPSVPWRGTEMDLESIKILETFSKQDIIINRTVLFLLFKAV